MCGGVVALQSCGAVPCSQRSVGQTPAATYCVCAMNRGVPERFLNRPVKHAVVTVPAYFNDAQRQETKVMTAVCSVGKLCASVAWRRADVDGERDSWLVGKLTR